MKNKIDYMLSKLVITPITGPWWNLTQFQKGYKHSHNYYVEVLDQNSKKPTKWMFKIEEVSIGKAGMKIGVSPIHTPKGNILLQLLSRRSIQSKRRTDKSNPNSYFAELWLHDISGQKNRLLVRDGDQKKLPPWIKQNYLKDKTKCFLRKAMDKKTKRTSVCVNINKQNAHRELIELFFASRVWILENQIFFRSPSSDDPNFRDSID